MVYVVTCHLLCVQKVEGVVHDTLIKHGVERHLPYAVCIEDGGVQCVIEHCVEHHLPYVVCVEDGAAAVCDRA